MGDFTICTGAADDGSHPASRQAPHVAALSGLSFSPPARRPGAIMKFTCMGIPINMQDDFIETAASEYALHKAPLLASTTLNRGKGERILNPDLVHKEESPWGLKEKNGVKAPSSMPHLPDRTLPSQLKSTRTASCKVGRASSETPLATVSTTLVD
nr:uncharacterized protein LOC129261461 [Lytechinus pictus]